MSSPKGDTQHTRGARIFVDEAFLRSTKHLRSARAASLPLLLSNTKPRHEQSPHKFSQLVWFQSENPMEGM